MSRQVSRIAGTWIEINSPFPCDMVGPIRSLDDVCGKGGSIHATCRDCGQIAVFPPSELRAYLRAKRLDTTWPNFARYIVYRCPVAAERETLRCDGRPSIRRLPILCRRRLGSRAKASGLPFRNPYQWQNPGKNDDVRDNVYVGNRFGITTTDANFASMFASIFDDTTIVTDDGINFGKLGIKFAGTLMRLNAAGISLVVAGRFHQRTPACSI